MIRTRDDLTAEEAKAHEAKWGNYNAFPPGWAELTEAEFAQSHFFTYPPVMSEYRQMLPPDKNMQVSPVTSATLQFLHDGTGFAVVSQYWEKRVRFFRFGCEHDYQPHDPGRPLFRCEHCLKCSKCGHVWTYDSSD